MTHPQTEAKGADAKAAMVESADEYFDRTYADEHPVVIQYYKDIYRQQLAVVDEIENAIVGKCEKCGHDVAGKTSTATPPRPLFRCMGGRFCSHLPGSCTATAWLAGRLHK